jgi:carbamoyltransferase
MVKELRKQHPDLENIALSGGVFANVKLNQRVKALGFKKVFVQPAMSDAGLSFGAALLEVARRNGDTLKPYTLQNVFLGVGYSNEEIKEEIDRCGLEATFYEEEELARVVARMITDKKVVAHFDGRMEYGPRALGNRSILYAAGDHKVNDWLNKQLRRTEFMPFAPAVMYEHASEYFLDIEGAEHTAEFMTITCDCTERAKKEIPAAVHVDGTARPQLVHRDHNPRFYAILNEYYKLTGIPSTINTSFNMHEEPIVATPYDAIRSYQEGHLDVLVLGNYVLEAK